MNYEVLLRNASFKECRDYVRSNSPEYVDVMPGYKIFERYLIGVPPISIGLQDDIIIFPYTKPCYGTFLLKVEDMEEAGKLRALKKKK
ncbi:MAG TPA: DUF1894 domain-containing protein [Methanoregulaceae archaeon]|nr:DUF1894 domain-containing protein [Methanoregulaceae archaeon]